MPQVSLTPADVEVLPRNREYDIARSLQRDWFDNHPFKTAWFNAMSITFPLGEKFFIDSVRHFSDQIDDPKLNEEIRGFCGQEGFHRREHQRYNETLCRLRGYDLVISGGASGEKHSSGLNTFCRRWNALRLRRHLNISLQSWPNPPSARTIP